MIKEIKLTRGFVAIVDEVDFEKAIGAGSWAASVKSNTVYAVHGIKKNDGRWTTTRLHNYLTDWPFVDHINGDGLDNRRSNLRPSSYRTNSLNLARYSSNTSGYKGVTWHKGAGKWASQIQLDRKHHHLGLFADLEDAARAYDAAAIELHGEFARLNFPKDE